MPASRVGIIVVNWNGAARTAACVTSLLALEHAGDAAIVVVDNGSSDDSVESLRREFAGVDVLALPSNLGYGGAANVGMEYLRRRGARYLWLLNNDTVIAPTALTALASAAESHGSPAIFAPKILAAGTDGVERIWSAGGTLRWPWLERGMRGQAEAAGLRDAPCELPWASGCSLFFPAEVVEIAGAFDERYFMYLEDVDWCLTARRRGVPTVYVPDARIWHGVSRSMRTLDPRIARYYDCRNYLLLAFRHAGPVGRSWAALRFAVTAAKICLRSMISPGHRRDALYHAQTRALWDAVRGRWGQAPYDDTPRPPRVSAPRPEASVR